MIRLTFFALIIASFSSVLLSGCGGGAQTEGNPNLGDESSDYRGPAAKTADILSFQNNVWVFLKENNRCGQCHSDDQDPTFVDSSDINKAYSEVIAYVDLLEPATAGLVTKVGLGHNCWLQSDAACASVIEQMLVNWANDSGVEGDSVLLGLEFP